MTAWSIIETVAGWWQWFLPRLGWWFLGSCAFALLWWVTAPVRHQEPRVLDKELAPPGADVLRLNGFRGGRGFTLIEAMIVVSLVCIAAAIIIPNAMRCGDGRTRMQRCAEECGDLARPALLPDGHFGVTCSCLPAGTQAVPYPVPVERR